MPDDNTPLPEDNDPPANPPSGPDDLSMMGSDEEQQPAINDAHPALDSNVDSHELYDEGTGGVVEDQSETGSTAQQDIERP